MFLLWCCLLEIFVNKSVGFCRFVKAQLSSLEKIKLIEFHLWAVRTAFFSHPCRRRTDRLWSVLLLFLRRSTSINRKGPSTRRRGAPQNHYQLLEFERFPSKSVKQLQILSLRHQDAFFLWQANYFTEDISLFSWFEEEEDEEIRRTDLCCLLQRQFVFT